MPKVVCNKCQQSVYFLPPTAGHLLLLCPGCNQLLGELAKQALTLPREPFNSFALPIEIHRKRAPAWMGPTGVVCLLFAISIGAFAITAFNYEWGSAYFAISLAVALMLAIFAGFLLAIYFPPRIDSAAKLLLDKAGLHDLRMQPNRLYRWQELNKLRCEFLTRDHVILGGSLQFRWCPPSTDSRTIELNCTGLDLNVEEIYHISLEQIARAAAEVTPSESATGLAPSPTASKNAEGSSRDSRAYWFHRNWIGPMWVFLAGLFLVLCTPLLLWVGWKAELPFLAMIFFGICALLGAVLIFFSGIELWDRSPKLQVDNQSLTDYRFTPPRSWTWESIRELELRIVRQNNRTTTATLAFSAIATGGLSTRERVEIDLAGLNTQPERIHRMIAERIP